MIKSDLEAYLERVVSEMSTERPGKEIVVASPYTGKCGPIEEISDPAFSGGMMGKGAYVELTDSDVLAPVDGEVSFVFETKHALGIRMDEDVTLLIHVGLDTVSLKGEGFEVFVKEGDRVKKGERIMRVDLDYIREHAPSLESPIVFGELTPDASVEMVCKDTIRAGENLLIIYLA